MSEYAKYIDDDTRLYSFEGWPHAEPRAEAVAAAGYFYQPVDIDSSSGNVIADDTVRCPCCDKVCSDFTPENAWELLSHRPDCPFKRNIKSAKQRLCRDCDIFFSSIGAKLNHSKRVHPRPEEERQERKRERLAAVARRQQAQAQAHAQPRKVRKASAAAYPRTTITAADTVSASAAVAAARARRIAAAALDLQAKYSGVPMMSTWKPINQHQYEDDDKTDDEMKDPHTCNETNNELSLSPLRVVVNSEPCAWAGEIVMSRAEYREFRQHFRAMTRIFRDVDPLKRS
ncbi:uncharacterized protein E0L32_003013 [Thyridium curvatum]|uniref:C2H2-type domain-containing protein n=1 Tax=Thyridium curvatum TaxID=1093900 RepID=A0A507B6J9_9PEZI|nr:uncharacterized protein E0L32_003013 [Thyridium curvatum]TPX17912.1 hypothetical protein E0L32_003013 [Thyridium curvatum]